MTILDGKKTSNDIKNEIAEEVKKMKAKGEKVPHLAAVIVGNDGASLTYVGSKVRACERIGFESTLIQLSNTTSEVELLDTIEELNNNDDIDGFIIQPTYGISEPSLDLLLELYDIVYPHYIDVKVVPQLHKFIGAP